MALYPLSLLDFDFLKIAEMIGFYCSIQRAQKKELPFLATRFGLTPIEIPY
jgi:hypothetical protein